jgi:membrane protein
MPVESTSSSAEGARAREWAAKHPHAPRLPANLRERGHTLVRQIRDSAKLLGPSARYLTTTEAHTYAYSVSANVLLAFYPFILLMSSLAAKVSSESLQIVFDLVRTYLPAGQETVVADMWILTSHHGAQIFSLVMLAISTTGVFLPLEVALNGIWGFHKNRSYLMNQAMSLGLVVGCGAMAYLSVLLATIATRFLADPIPWRWLHAAAAFVLLKGFAIPAAMGGFFLIYWWLPNGKVSPRQVFPAAFYTGLAAEVFKTVFQWVLPLLDFKSVYRHFSIGVTLIIWGWCGALLLLFGASLSARGALHMPHLRVHNHHHGRAQSEAAAAGTPD